MTGQPLLDIDHLRSWIGRVQEAEDTVTPDLVRKFAATLDLPAPSLALSAPAPRLLHFCLAQPVVPTAGLGPDGHPERGGFLPPVPLQRRMWAGGSVTFARDLGVGDSVGRQSRIADVVLKQGRSGALCFVTVEHLYRVDGTVAVSEMQTLVYRDLADNRSGEEPPPAEAGVYRRHLRVDAPLLFRYSALTFNGHRIHYDRRHAIETEHYPGLVVHAPLQATWLYNLAAELRGRPPEKFSFRSLSTLFDDDDIVLNASEHEGRLKLWTARDGGPVAMMAEAG